MHTQSINKKLIASLLGLGLVALLIASLTIGSGGATADRSSAGDSQAFPTGEPGPGISQFSVLEPADSFAAGEIPASVASVLAELPATSDGQGDSVVNALGVASSGSASSQVLLAEVNNSVCVLATGAEYQGAAVGSCPSITEAESGDGYVVVQGLSKDSVRVIGIAPDGVASVSIDNGADGTVDEEATVSGNVYQADLDKAPTTVSGLTASNDVQFQTELPLAGSAG